MNTNNNEFVNNSQKFVHCKEDCPYNDHCLCVFECSTFMIGYDDCDYYKDIGYEDDEDRYL